MGVSTTGRTEVILTTWIVRKKPTDYLPANGSPAFYLSAASRTKSVVYTLTVSVRQNQGRGSSWPHRKGEGVAITRAN